jgi:hypothetical protein
MKKELFTLTCVKDPRVGGYTVYMESMPGLIVEVKDLKDAPKEIAALYPPIGFCIAIASAFI